MLLRPQEDSSDSEDDSDAEETKAEIEQKQYEVDELNDKLENAQAEQKQLFLILFQVCFSVSICLLSH